MRSSFRWLLAVWVGGMVLLIVGLLLELSEWYHFLEVGKSNRFAIAFRSRMDQILEREMPLWKEPYRIYKNNAYLTWSIGNKQHFFKTNSRGFRTYEYQLPKPKGKFRIVCVGASTTVEGVTNDSTYPAILERSLNHDLATDRVEVENCGVSAISSQVQVQKLPVYLREEPDMILEYCGVNDICWVLIPRWSNSGSYLRKLAKKSKFLTNHFDSWFLPSMESIRRDLQDTILANLNLLYHTLKSQNVELVICTFAHPDLSRCTKEERDFFDQNLKVFWKASTVTIEKYCMIMDAHNENLRKFSQDRSLLLVPVAEELQGGTDLFDDICHLTDEGIQRKAKIISTHLEEHIKEKLE